MKLLLITPPFTQLNTPYPATMYLKGYLNTIGIESKQCDIGIEVINILFSSKYLKEIFDLADPLTLDDDMARIYYLKEQYINSIDSVMSFLKGKLNSLAYQINDKNFLPTGHHFQDLDSIDYSFGDLGIIDKAKHICTLYLEDIGDFIQRIIDPYFGFNRYGEHLAQSASSYDEISAALEKDNNFIYRIIGQCLESHVLSYDFAAVGITIPFLGNLYGALLCAKHLKRLSPNIKVIVGGGYVNTELRNVVDERFFKYIDFLSFDDGEAPLKLLIEHLQGNRPISELKRIKTLLHGTIHHIDNTNIKDVPQRETGTPDYSDLYLDQYLSMLEITNPMHRLWSDGRWNKLTLAHGCYWGKCSFCDISLDYIARYEPITASIICDRMEAIINQTGEHGFHFVDEAAPPALMGELAIEIINRKLQVTWWTNIRFEKNFSPGLCKLLRASGCIAVTGGLEVASDRLLKLMEKGVTVEQVANVSKSFTDSDIMVHAYLMYGFPTQTDQETIDSLEVVRQLFESGVLKSGFWHRFAMTAHSPVGLYPVKYKVKQIGPTFEGFAQNDYFHDDPLGADHDIYSKGLKTSLHNFMNGVGFDLSLQKWFDHKICKTSHSSQLINNYIKSYRPNIRSNAIAYYIGILPRIILENKKSMELRFYTKSENLDVDLDIVEAKWLINLLPAIALPNNKLSQISYADLKNRYENETGYDFEEMRNSDFWIFLEKVGLIIW